MIVIRCRHFGIFMKEMLWNVDFGLSFAIEHAQACVKSQITADIGFQSQHGGDMGNAGWRPSYTGSI